MVIKLWHVKEREKDNIVTYFIGNIRVNRVKTRNCRLTIYSNGAYKVPRKERA